MSPERPFLGDGVRKLGHAKFSHAPAFDTLDSADHPPSIRAMDWSLSALLCEQCNHSTRGIGQ